MNMLTSIALLAIFLHPVTAASPPTYFNLTSTNDFCTGRGHPSAILDTISGADREVMKLMCEYWPEDKWGVIEDSDLNEVAALAENGELAKIREKSVQWTKAVRSSSKFCWRKLMKKRENRKAMCVGPGLSGNSPGLGWKCKRNCRDFCRDEFQNHLGKTSRLFWCKCPVNGSFGRIVDPPCSEGESLIMGKCYKTCPAGMRPSLIPGRCSTDCSHNTNGLVKTCGLGCSRSAFECGTAIGAMVAFVGASVLGASAELAPPLASSILLGLSKMIALVAEVIQGLSSEIKNLLRGRGLNVGRLVMMGAMMFTYFTEMDANPDTLLKGALPYSESIQGIINLANQPRSERVKAGIENLMGVIQEKFSAVSGSIVNIFAAFSQPQCT